VGPIQAFPQIHLQRDILNWILFGVELGMFSCPCNIIIYCWVVSKSERISDEAMKISLELHLMGFKMEFNLVDWTEVFMLLFTRLGVYYPALSPTDLPGDELTSVLLSVELWKSSCPCNIFIYCWVISKSEMISDEAMKRSCELHLIGFEMSFYLVDWDEFLKGLFGNGGS